MKIEYKKPPTRSATVIARKLGCEGFSDEVAGLIKKYYLQRHGLTDRQKGQIDRIENELTELTHDMSESQRLLLGKFIGLHKKMSFDAGLTIGLMTLANELAEEDRSPGMLENEIRGVERPE